MKKKKVKSLEALRVCQPTGFENVSPQVDLKCYFPTFIPFYCLPMLKESRESQKLFSCVQINFKCYYNYFPPFITNFN